ncbi:MAG: 4-(cytidine 5'-diphospho)-2-C-methyl-D-erythritol kinase [Kiritimatiellae bacterium]|nr:4-(cytidine 5'-diphospho)-2-C-methyl-D-erythritol kinase [Kiritimatiellia bacterium]
MVKAGSAITVEAPAKINLTLEILGKRPDGYHELRSVVMPVNLYDSLSLTSTYAQTVITVTFEAGVDVSKLCPADKNLAVRAARLIQERYRVNAGARIHIHKRIPIGGGLGGGSADAAGVIRGLNRLWGLEAPLPELMAVGAEVGCDVPALVHGGAVLMEGRGERVSGLFGDGPPEVCEGFWLVLANPGVMCSTPEIFRKWRAGLTARHTILHNMLSSIRASDVSAAAKALHNGLQTAVYESYPVIARTARLLDDAGCLGVLLSGSGASVFGLVRDEIHGQEVSRKLEAGLWHVLVRTCPVV